MRVCYYPSMAKIKDTAEGFNGVFRRLQLGFAIIHQWRKSRIRLRVSMVFFADYN
ncbi:hypothetical protein BVRB_7g158110 isoform C [Beta vulgaris subsp. vulgaris]|nr:hypothetical protein BVRB_7g158110 isoform C [Beta vulgaris subsp. vulgaris]